MRRVKVQNADLDLLHAIQDIAAYLLRNYLPLLLNKPLLMIVALIEFLHLSLKLLQVLRAHQHHRRFQLSWGHFKEIFSMEILHLVGQHTLLLIELDEFGVLQLDLGFDLLDVRTAYAVHFGLHVAQEVLQVAINDFHELGHFRMLVMRLQLGNLGRSRRAYLKQ